MESNTTLLYDLIDSLSDEEFEEFLDDLDLLDDEGDEDEEVGEGLFGNKNKGKYGIVYDNFGTLSILTGALFDSESEAQDALKKKSRESDPSWFVDPHVVPADSKEYKEAQKNTGKESVNNNKKIIQEKIAAARKKKEIQEKLQLARKKKEIQEKLEIARKKRKIQEKLDALKNKKQDTKLSAADEAKARIQEKLKVARRKREIQERVKAIRNKNK